MQLRLNWQQMGHNWKLVVKTLKFWFLLNRCTASWVLSWIWRCFYYSGCHSYGGRLSLLVYYAFLSGLNDCRLSIFRLHRFGHGLFLQNISLLQVWLVLSSMPNFLPWLSISGFVKTFSAKSELPFSSFGLETLLGCVNSFHLFFHRFLIWTAGCLCIQIFFKIIAS